MNAAQKKKVRTALHAEAFLRASFFHSLVIFWMLRNPIAHVYRTFGLKRAESFAGQPHFLATGKENRLGIADDMLFNQFPIEPIADGFQAAFRRAWKPRVQHSMRKHKIRRSLCALRQL